MSVSLEGTSRWLYPSEHAQTVNLSKFFYGAWTWNINKVQWVSEYAHEGAGGCSVAALPFEKNVFYDSFLLFHKSIET